MNQAILFILYNSLVPTLFLCEKRMNISYKMFIMKVISMNCSIVLILYLIVKNVSNLHIGLVLSLIPVVVSSIMLFKVNSYEETCTDSSTSVNLRGRYMWRWQAVCMTSFSSTADQTVAAAFSRECLLMQLATFCFPLNPITCVESPISSIKWRVLQFIGTQCLFARRFLFRR